MPAPKIMDFLKEKAKSNWLGKSIMGAEKSIMKDSKLYGHRYATAAGSVGAIVGAGVGLSSYYAQSPMDVERGSPLSWGAVGAVAGFLTAGVPTFLMHGRISYSANKMRQPKPRSRSDHVKAGGGRDGRANMEAYKKSTAMSKDASDILNKFPSRAETPKMRKTIMKDGSIKTTTMKSNETVWMDSILNPVAYLKRRGEDALDIESSILNALSRDKKSK